LKNLHTGIFKNVWALQKQFKLQLLGPWRIMYTRNIL